MQGTPNLRFTTVEIYAKGSCDPSALAHKQFLLIPFASNSGHSLLRSLNHHAKLMGLLLNYLCSYASTSSARTGLEQSH